MKLSEGDLVRQFGVHEPMLRSYIHSRLPKRIQNVVDPEDILQETYSDAWKHINDFRGGSLAAWLKTVTLSTGYVPSEHSVGGETSKPGALELVPMGGPLV